MAPTHFLADSIRHNNTNTDSSLSTAKEAEQIGEQKRCIRSWPLATLIKGRTRALISSGLFGVSPADESDRVKSLQAKWHSKECFASLIHQKTNKRWEHSLLFEPWKDGRRKRDVLKESAAGQRDIMSSLLALYIVSERRCSWNLFTKTCQASLHLPKQRSRCHKCQWNGSLFGED